jgi:hypothetical protein
VEVSLWATVNTLIQSDKMQKFTLSTLALATLVAGCGGAPSSNELRLDNDGNGLFSGTAGNAWTPAEIILQACGPNQAASDFRTVASDAGSGAFAFGGRCSGGTNATLPSPQNSADVISVPHHRRHQLADQPTSRHIRQATRRQMGFIETSARLFLPTAAILLRRLTALNDGPPARPSLSETSPDAR